LTLLSESVLSGLNHSSAAVRISLVRVTLRRGEFISGWKVLPGVFSALLEKIGVNPVVTLVPGHAFISVEDAPGASSLDWPVETTMLGNGASFSEAWSAGAAQYNEQSTAGNLTRVPLDEVRADGIMEMPR